MAVTWPSKPEAEVRAGSVSVSAGSLSGEGRMAQGPSPGTVSGHLGEAQRTVAAGPRQPRPKAREERLI